ncbi:MAG: ribosome recycling factor [Puniceicoccales bacterium]|jgi:ribosome recycling factor|nr:ribosome recycling factor [Puniceicoccales bacterium]
MDTNAVIKNAKTAMAKAIEHTHDEFNSLHTGKASVGMVDCIVAEIYGSQMRIKDIAAITTPDPHIIHIQPWDKESLKPIEKAIIAANIGLSPAVDGMIIRCNIPEMSRERRQDLAKVANTMAEEGRVSVRGGRRDTLDLLKKAQKASEISEDDLKRLEKDVQKLTDISIGEIDEILNKKITDLMKV